MFLKITKKIGKPVCILLYAVCIAAAVKKKVIPLISLVTMHLTEYFIIGRKTGKEKNLSPLTAFLSCLAFGFTWWLPLRKNSDQ